MARPPETERRGNTLTKATDYVLAHGLAGLRLRPLATALGTSTRMLLYDFGSKEQLVAEILTEARSREAALLAEQAPAAGTRNELLHGVWAWMSAPERAPFMRLFFEVYVGAMTQPAQYPSGASAMVTDWLDEMGARFAEQHADGRGAATLVIAVLRGLLLDRLVTGDDARTDLAASYFADLLDPRDR